MWYRSGTQLVPFDTFMQGSSKVSAKPRRSGSCVSTGDWAQFAPRSIATPSLKNAGIRVAQVTAGTRCYTQPQPAPRAEGGRLVWAGGANERHRLFLAGGPAHHRSSRAAREPRSPLLREQ